MKFWEAQRFIATEEEAQHTVYLKFMDDIDRIWKIIEPFAEKREFPKKSRLLNEGDVSRYLFFIKQGCIRSWFNNDGEDITFQFFFEGSFVSSIESFKKKIPSLFNLETLESTILYAIHREVFFSMKKNNPLLEDAINEVLYRRLYHYQKLFLSRIKNNPQLRYEELVRECPGIIKRVPSLYIASYLGITPVSLSRIKNRTKINNC